MATVTPEHSLRALAEKYDDGDGEAEALTRQALERLEWRRRRAGKECSGCGLAKPLTAFAARFDAADGLRGTCRACEYR